MYIDTKDTVAPACEAVVPSHPEKAQGVESADSGGLSLVGSVRVRFRAAFSPGPQARNMRGAAVFQGTQARFSGKESAASICGP